MDQDCRGQGVGSLLFDRAKQIAIEAARGNGMRLQPTPSGKP